MIKKITCSNSLELPKTEKKVEIETSDSILDIKKHLKEEFELSNTKFVLFLKIGDKWFHLSEEKKILDDYDIKDQKLILDIKRTIALDKIKKMKSELKLPQDTEYPYGILHVENASSEKARKLLVTIAQKFVEDSLRDPSNASFSIPNRGGDNIGFDDESELVLLGKQRTARQFRNLSSVKSVRQLTSVMNIIHGNLKRNIHSTKRDIYYGDVTGFEGKQSISDNLIEDLGALLGVTRNSMNVSASSKGIVIGHVEFTEKGDFIDCRKMGSGKSISPNIDYIDNLQSDAEFVLLVEKDAIFSRLAEDHFYDYIPSIIITAKGQPDMATRSFLKKINDELQLPILAIMDADVYGFEILRVYSVGSKALSFEASNLAVPNIKWLGLLPSDLEEESEFNISRDVLIKMEEADFRRCELLLEEEFVKRKKEWTDEINKLIKLRHKAEIQALYSIDQQYISDHYLPMKLETGNFI